MRLCDGSDEVVLGDGGLDEGVGERGGAAEDLSTLNRTVSGFSLPRRYSREEKAWTYHPYFLFQGIWGCRFTTWR